MPTPATPKPLDFVDVFLIISGVIAFFMVLLLLAFDKIPTSNMQLFTVVVSFVAGTWLGTLIQNRFGSSKGSDSKGDVLSDIAVTATKAPPDA